jgi:uncharacterized protein YigA (DUF484 family)
MNDPEILKINEEIAQKFRKVGEGLAGRRTAVELFETLLTAIGAEFCIPFVWLSVIRRPETADLLRELEQSELLHNQLNVIDEETFLEVTGGGTAPLLANGDLRPFYRLLPPNPKYFIRSLAVAPLFLHGLLVASLNHGDASPVRYQPGMDTALLGRLAGKVSEHLSRILPP